MSLVQTATGRLGAGFYMCSLLGFVVLGGSLFVEGRSPRVARGYAGAVATASPEASAAGLAMLEAGGNAADALVAASFAVSVTRPQSTGLGGGGFIIYHDAASGREVAIDCRETAPAKASRDMYLDASGRADGELSQTGALAAGVPGLVAGLLEFHEKFGKLSRAAVMAPAIRLAQGGFPVDSGLAYATRRYRAKLARYPATKQVFLPADRPLREGQWLVQSDLARTLRTIAMEGRAGFYSGRVAASIASAVQRRGGLMTKEDLAAYRPRWRSPLVGSYHGHRVVTMPPPGGGLHLLQMLNILEGYELGQYEHGSAQHIHYLAEAMKRAYADRATHSGDPDFWSVPTSFITSKGYAARRRAEIDPLEASSSDAVSAAAPPPDNESDETTHIAIVDAAGNAASSTQTVNTLLGSKLVAEGTGVVMNNEMDDFSAKPGVPNHYGLLGSEANAIAAGKRPLSSMSPSLVFHRQGGLAMAVGTPGGSRIMTSVLQVIINRVDFELPALEAVSAPRVHHQWKPATAIRIERPGLGDELVAELRARGHELQVKGPMCNVQVVFRDARSGALTAVSDPRGTGRPGAR